MVNSKKMSKSSVAVIVLAILLVLSMVLGLTGAWFTHRSDDNLTGNGALKLGSIGKVSITATGATWTQGIKDDSRTYVMPGDTVTCGAINIKYTQETEGDEAVYYVIKSGTDFYRFSAQSGDAIVLVKDEASATAADRLEVNANITTKAQYAVTSVGNVALDGQGDKVLNVDQGANVSYTSVGFVQDGANYEVRIIQTSNLSAETAYELLKAGTLIVA